MNSAHITALVSLVWLMACRCLAGETATAVATVTAGFVTAITVTSSGSGYTSEPTVTLSGGGGSGATAKAIVSGDTVSLVVVLTSGSGYTTSPAVTIEAPPKQLGVKVELVPKLTVDGPPGATADVEWTLDPAGPWTVWTNIVVRGDGSLLVDVSPGSATKFYRVKLGAPQGFVWIQPGTFQMGSPLSEKNREDDEKLHTVTLTHGFWLCDHEVTQAEYEAVMAVNPSQYRGADLPVEQVSWADAVLYCQRLTERDRAAGWITAQQAYRLPTEAEWEYAARAGTIDAQYGDLVAIAWTGGGFGTHTIKDKQPNAWGLYDMIGNVWEWCSDWYGEYSSGDITDPTGPSTGSTRISRGSSWDYHNMYARAANRDRLDPNIQTTSRGFRVALSSVR